MNNEELASIVANVIEDYVDHYIDVVSKIAFDNSSFGLEKNKRVKMN